MENFRPLAYKRPPYQEASSSEASPEQLEQSERIALEKLEKITNPEFRDFSVRFMTLEEYRLMVEEGKLGGRDMHEVVKHGPEGSDAVIHDNFEEFVEKYRPYRIRNYTDWDHSMHQLEAEGQFADYYLKNILSQKKPRKKKLEEIREVILKALRERSNRSMEALESEGILGKGSWGYIEDTDILVNELSFLSPQDIQDIKKAIEEKAAEKVDFFDMDRVELLAKDFGKNPEEIAKIEKFGSNYEKELRFGKENIKVLRKLEEDPEYIYQKGALREVLTALYFAFDGGSVVRERQYQIAVIFDNETFGFQAQKFGRYEHWASFHDDYKKRDSLTPQEKGRGILAAVSLSRMKDSSEEMAKLTEGTGDFAHPVFQIIGTQTTNKDTQKAILRWPSKERG